MVVVADVMGVAAVPGPVRAGGAAVGGGGNALLPTPRPIERIGDSRIGLNELTCRCLPSSFAGVGSSSSSKFVHSEEEDVRLSIVSARGCTVGCPIDDGGLRVGTDWDDAARCPCFGCRGKG